MTHVSDELLSALLDGETSVDDDLEHVETCESCRDRLERLRRVTVALAAPTPLPAPHLREAAVAVALSERRPGNAVIGRWRSKRRAGPVTGAPARRASAASAAAALIVALGVGGWAISQIGGGPEPTNTTTAGALGDRASTTAAFGNDAFSAGGGALSSADESAIDGDSTAPEVSHAYDAGDIGEFNDVNAVAQKAAADLGQEPEVQARHPYAGPDPCGHDDNASLKWHAAVIFNGVDAWARVVDFGDAKWLLQVQKKTDCVLIETQEIEPTTPR